MLFSDAERGEEVDHVNRKTFFVEYLFLIFLLFAGWKLRSRNLHYVMGISEVVLLTAVLKMIPLLELSVDGLIVMASFMLFNKLVLQCIYFPWYDHSHITPFMLLLSLELFVLIRGIRRKRGGYGIITAYAVICCGIALYLFQKCEGAFLPYYFESVRDFVFIGKVLLLLAGISVVSAAILFIVHCFYALMKKWLIKLQKYSMIYTEIDRSVMLVLILTLCCLMMTEVVPLIPEDNTYGVPLLWIGLCTMIVMIQIIYIRLLVKGISVKEKMRLQENDLQQLAEYNQELENNMEDMRGIRHDIKNLFLTMGGFIDRSNDEEMKIFYAENIIPFAKQELQKNDLYVKLADIRDESMKSFLYFKIMQGIEQNVPIDLQVQFINRNKTFCIGQTDLIRILGILLDNAIEEARACEGTAAVFMKETEREYFFSISNTVRRQTKEKGVAAGMTDKGLGRGNGLLIADKLIQKYKNVLLNSYFKENEFVQCLRIEK